MRNMFDFEECFKDITGGNIKIKQSEYLESGKYPVVDQGKNLIGGYSNLNDIVVRKGDVIVFGDHTGIIKFIDFDFILGADGVKVIEPDYEKIDPKYAYYFLSKIELPNTGYDRKFKYLKRTQVLLPPLEIQHKIAAILDSADDYRQKTKALIDKYDQLVQSLFLNMFGDPVSNKNGWEITTIRELILEARYGTSAKSVETGKYPYIRMNNISYQGFMDYSDLKYIDVSDSEKEKYLVRKGDVIFNRTNSKELVGKTGIITTNKEMIIAGYLIRLRVNKLANPYFIWGHLNSKWGKLTLMNMCKNIVGMANINAQEMQDIKILKAPISLQNQFAERIQLIDAQKQQAQSSLQKAEELFNSLLQRAFNGEIISNQYTSNPQFREDLTMV